MSTKYIASNWRLPNQENSSKSDNYGLSFDGSEYIDCGNPASLQITGNITLSTWVKTSMSSTGFVISKDNLLNRNYGLVVVMDGGVLRARFFIFKSNVLANVTSTTINIGDNNWHNIVGVNDGTDLKIYIDGNLEATNVGGGGTIDNDSVDLNIGRRGDNNLFFNGSISEASIFDYALSSTQISTLYGSSSLGAGNPMALKPQPVAYYPLGDNSASNPLTQPNEAVEDASVFDFANSATDFISSDVNITGDWSVSMWVNTDSTSYQTALQLSSSASTGTQDSIIFVRNTFESNKWGFYDGSTVLLGSVLDINKWHNLMLTKNGTTYTLFLNGTQESQSTKLNINITDLLIGKRSFSNFFFDGQISNVVLWNSDQSLEKDNIYNSGVPATSYTNTPTAWYKLDQSANWDVSGSGYWDIPDASGNGNSGISSGMTSANLVLTDLTRNLPFDSYSFNFDNASNDYISTAFNIPSGNKAVSFWFNSSYAGYQCILGNANDAFILGSFSSQIPLPNGISYMQGSSGKTFGVTASVTDEFADGQWHHFVYIYDGNSKIYIDGTERTISYKAGTSSSDDIVTITNLGLGLNRSTYPKYTGKLSNVSIFDEALTSTEVMKLYSNGMPQDLTSFTPAPVAWYPLGSNSFWNGSQWTVRDMIGSNDGTGQNIGVDGLVGDSPRSEANGTGTNMDIPTNLEGNTKWSENNSWSINMSSTARVQDTP